MTALLTFIHICFIRSYRFGPPTFIFLGGIVFIYTVIPNPVMESYAFSTVFLFVISAVLSYLLMDIESANQESVTMLQAGGSVVKLYVAKLLYGWLYTIPLALFAVLYPAIFNKFDRNAAFAELTMAFLYHIAVGWLAISLACWFSAKFIQSRLYSFLTLSLLIVITLSSQGIADKLPAALKQFILLMPPLYRIQHVLFNYDQVSVNEKVFALGLALVYGLLLASVYLLVLHKRKLDQPPNQ